MKRRAGVVALILAVGGLLFVVDQAVRTLQTLTVVERERDTWQRPEDIIRRLDVGPGDTVVDLGSGAGYFALKIAPRIAPSGRLLAVDLRRQSLAFLWIRAVLDGHSNLDIIHAQVDDPRLPRGLIDAALIANTYHELAVPEPILKALFATMRPGGRLVVVDRGPRASHDSREMNPAHHDMTAAVAEREISEQGFEVTARDDRFIDRPEEDDIWWLIVFRRL